MISKQEIFSIQTEADFKQTALRVFNFQAENNLVYSEFLNHLRVDVNTIDSIEKIPFLPIRFFKDFENG